MKRDKNEGLWNVTANLDLDIFFKQSRPIYQFISCRLEVKLALIQLFRDWTLKGTTNQNAAFFESIQSECRFSKNAAIWLVAPSRVWILHLLPFRPLSYYLVYGLQTELENGAHSNGILSGNERFRVHQASVLSNNCLCYFNNRNINLFNKTW